MTREDREFLASLKAGDEVAFIEYGLYPRKEVIKSDRRVKVVKVKPTQVVFDLHGGDVIYQRVSKKTGNFIPKIHWSRSEPLICDPTSERYRDILERSAKAEARLGQREKLRQLVSQIKNGVSWTCDRLMEYSNESKLESLDSVLTNWAEENDMDWPKESR